MRTFIASIILVSLTIYGISLRVNYHSVGGYNGDEFFALSNMQKLKLDSVLKRTSFYGDHTSYPGEFLLHYPFMKWAGIFENPILVENGIAQNVTIDQMDKITAPKHWITILGVWLFFGLAISATKTYPGFGVALLIFLFHPHLIRHAVEIRPYGVLPELAIFNYMLAEGYFRRRRENIEDRQDKGCISILYSVILFVTFIYHAYGILIAGLPLMYHWIKNNRIRLTRGLIAVLVISVLAWVYYASNNTFGWTPNRHQSINDAFQYIPKDLVLFNEKLGYLMFGNVGIFALIAPVVFLSMIKFREDLLFLGLLVVLPIILIVLVDIKTQYWIHPRQWIWVIPFFCLWIGKQIDSLLEAKRV